MGRSLVSEIPGMDKKACKEHFYQLVSPSLPNEWEVDDIIDALAKLNNEHQEILFSQISAIWPVSHSLCLSFLEEGSAVIGGIPVDLVPQWVRTILRSYEKDGLASARQYISQVDEKFLDPLNSQNEVKFEDISARMLFYIRGVSGQNIDIEKELIAQTDTSTLYIPQSISVLPHYSQNQLVYKFLLTLHWGFIRFGTFKTSPSVQEFHIREETSLHRPDRDIQNSVPDFFYSFADIELAADLFFLLEIGRVLSWIRKDLPGLAKQFSGLNHDLIQAFPQTEKSSVSSAVIEFAYTILFNNSKTNTWLKNIYLHDRYEHATTEEVISDLREFYDDFAHLSGPYVRPPLLNLLGKHNFNRASKEIEKRRVKTKQAFILQLQALQKKIQHKRDSRASTEQNSADQSVIVVSEREKESTTQHVMGIIDNPDVELPDELATLIREIKNDLGHIPKSYFSAASGVSGKGFNPRGNAVELPEEQNTIASSIQFDEWDYRRSGYRTNWCQLYEKQLPVLQSTFVSSTLEKHRGLLLKLRRQFELMKTSEHFVRRQREGVDLDLDAIVEARGDQRAGISPSENLFVRLHRNERDIATVFLIDMSNSTEGWVGNVIKESLVLLCEVMDVAGDPYGILGFSGMRRSRCEIYTIKGIEETYSQLIHQRINSIMPREYTRMGSAIRYSTQYLKNCEARTRLLVTITDGKPEDYDDYKGEYAIEDTRKALMESRGCGMHAFCITVDREAHDYLPRMYGKGNYIFIDDIKKLPFKMVDLYRLLTT